MRIEGINSFSLPGHNDDQPALGNTTKLGNRRSVIEDVLDDMRTNDRIKARVFEWKSLDRRLDELKTF